MSPSPPEAVTGPVRRSLPPIPPRYSVGRQIGVGGMAAIWVAEDEVLRRSVAIKVLAEQLAEQPAFVARFEREARMAAALSGHPHVITIYDVGQFEGRPFIVMEYLAGGTVADRLEDGARPDPADALQWLADAASALDFAHERGVVHRDVKPQNLLLDERGRLVVADLGIARAAFDTSLTTSGELLGTAAYMAPEQVDGGVATPASDRYGLGVVAYRLLTGFQPFPGGTLAEQAHRKLADDPPRPSEVAPELPPSVDAVLARALDRDPARRWETSTAFAEALAEALEGAPRPVPALEPTTQAIAAEPSPEPAVSPEPAEPAERFAPAAPPARPALQSTWQPVRRRPWGALLAATLAALLLGAGALWGLGAFDGSGDAPLARKEGNSKSADGTAKKKPAKRNAPAPADNAAAPPAAASPASLNDQGFALMKQGRYAEAVPLLQRAVAGFPAGSKDLTHAYALYNLGRSLRLAGRPAEAIPVLERRLKFANQRGTVARELAAARRQAG